MKMIKDFFKGTSLLPYLIVMMLTLIIAWFLFREQDKEVTSHDLTLTEIKTVGKLELVRITIKDVIEHKVTHKLVPDSRLLMVISGEVAGCIDLQKITEADITRNDSTLIVQLPAPEICFVAIDHKQSHIYQAATYPFIDNDGLLVQEMYRKAATYFQSDSLKQVVFKQTAINADRVLKPLLEKLSGKRVSLVFDKRLIKG
jgi:hypothetical protein